MDSKKREGNILVSVALAGGMLLFMAAFINAGLKAIHPVEKGSVQGVFIAQRSTIGPSAVPTTATARATNTPFPAPTIHLIMKNTAGVVTAIPGITVCDGTWGGTVIAGAFSTSNCVYSPAGDIQMPVDQYKNYGSTTGLFIKVPSGYTVISAVPDFTSTFVSTSGKDERSEAGFAYGWSSSYINSGTFTLTLTVQEPPLYGYIVGGNTIMRVSYYKGQATTTACGDQTVITTCGSAPAPVIANAVGTQCVVGSTSYAIYSSIACPAATAVPTKAPTAVPTAASTTAPTTKPVCAQDCSLQPKGDADCSLAVDSYDYAIWKTVFLGQQLPTELKDRNVDPDFNHDGKVNLVDLQTWQDGLYNPPPTPNVSCTVPTVVKPTSILPTLGPGCAYKQVQCVQAPCDPIIVCPQVTPTAVPTVAPAASTQSWTTMSLAGAPTARQNPASVWTGTEMVVLGGCGGSNGGCSDYLGDGGKYNPTTNTWSAIPTGYANLGTKAFWTGTEVLTWGCNCDSYGGGGRYNPSTNTWTGMNNNGSPSWPQARSSASMVWSGTELLVWGGYESNSSADKNTGARYNPTSNSWTAMTTTNAPSARDNAQAVWTGTEMIIWGGELQQNVAPYTTALNTGSRYNPSTNTWTAMSNTNAPTGRVQEHMVWTGNTGDATTSNRLILWGGMNPDAGTKYFDGKIYNPSTDTWTNMAAPAGVTLGSIGGGSVWTGNTGDTATANRLIIWGGSDYNTGGIYNPKTDTWTATTQTGVPGGRVFFANVWTGSKMIIWGGNNPSTNLNTGAVFSP